MTPSSLNSDPGERVLPFSLFKTAETSPLKDIINAEFFAAASSVFSKMNWDFCGGGHIEEYAFCNKITKRDFGLGRTLDEFGGLSSVSFDLFRSGCDSPSFDFIVPFED